MRSSSEGAAPGKVILLGEHTVVFGEPAIAAAIDRRLAVSVRIDREPSSSGDPRIDQAVALAAGDFAIDPRTLRVDITSDIPPACGLGSSAAFSLALVRALASLAERGLSVDEIRAHASRVEDVFHGTASGVDVAAAADGGVIWFERSDPPRIERLSVAKPLDVVVALSGQPRSTAGPVARLRARHAARPDLYGRFFRLAGELARAGREALGTGDLEALGELMDAAQGLLNALGVSTAILERMIGIARGAGALGAKLTGAGGGGAIIALAPSGNDAIVGELRAAGFETFASRIGGGRQEDEDAKSNRRSA
jgi:mevalonate kinase